MGFEEGVEELVSMNASNLWRAFRDGVLGACNWVWEGVLGRHVVVEWVVGRHVVEWRAGDAMAEGRAAFRELCGFPLKENGVGRRHVGNQAKEIVAGAMGGEANWELNDLYQSSGGVFCFLAGVGEVVMDNWVLLRNMGKGFGGST